MLPACDISKYQGAWQDYPCDIVLIKMSGGDNGLYMDPDATTNYNDAKAAGKAVGGYHFVGWTENTVPEATYFLQAMSPLAENDVYALDVENGAVDIPADAVEYITQMADTIYDKIGVWPLIYVSLSTLNAFDWSPVLANCGLWLADWNDDPNATLPTLHNYIMQQYSDGPVYDHDEWFDTIAVFNEYGYHAPTAPPPAPAPPVPTPPVVSPPVPSPAPASPPEPTPPAPEPPKPTPNPAPPAPTKPPVVVKPPAPVIVQSRWERFLNWFDHFWEN